MTKFEKQCTEAAEKAGIDVCEFDRDESRHTTVTEDDGALIIRKCGVRAVFGIGQDRPVKEQNERIKSVLTELKMEKHIESNLLTQTYEEECEEEDVCPRCDGDGKYH